MISQIIFDALKIVLPDEDLFEFRCPNFQSIQLLFIINVIAKASWQLLPS